MALGNLVCDSIQAYPAYTALSAVKVLVDEGSVETYRLENLGAGIGGNRRYPHLRHNLENAFGSRLHIISHRLARFYIGQDSFANHVHNRVESEVGIYGGGTVAEQKSHMVDFPRLGGFDHQTNLSTSLLSH